MQQSRAISKEMCFYCFDSLINHLDRAGSPKKPNFTNDPYPLFVTWTDKSDNLKGCIGTFSPTNLHKGLKEFAIESATNDTRFNPITKDEISNLKVAVSLLTNFEPAANYLDWEVGVNGIRIEFLSDRGGRRSATYLPEVASEQGWSKEEAIDSLLKKGGAGRITQEMRDSISLTRYRSEKMKATFDDYRRWKEEAS